MHRRTFLMSLVVTALGALAHCENNNGCEEALKQTMRISDTICGETAYTNTAFCATCVRAGRYSTTGASDCRCRFLAFDQSACASPTDDDATSDTRAAIDWANQSCASFSLNLTAPDAAVDASSDSSDGAAETAD